MSFSDLSDRTVFLFDIFCEKDILFEFKVFYLQFLAENLSVEAEFCCKSFLYLRVAVMFHFSLMQNDWFKYLSVHQNNSVFMTFFCSASILHRGIAGENPGLVEALWRVSVLWYITIIDMYYVP